MSEEPKSNTTVAALERMRAEVERAIACRPKVARMSEEQEAKYAEEDARVAALTEAIETLWDAEADDAAHRQAQPDRMDGPRFNWLSQRVTAGTAKPGEICALLAEARRARADADSATDLAELLKRGLDAAQAAAEGRPVDGAISDRTVEAVLRLRSEFDRLRGSSTGAAVATPDGPHYRTAVQAKPGERVEYMPAQTLAIARDHALVARSTNKHAWLQVTHNLGHTWTDCADDGGPVSAAAPASSAP